MTSSIPDKNTPTSMTKMDIENAVSEIRSVPISKVTIKDGMIQIEKKHTLIPIVSLHQFVKGMEEHKLEKIISSELFAYFKSADKPKGFFEKVGDIFSAGFDEFAGVSTTQHYERKENITFEVEKDSTETGEKEVEKEKEKEVTSQSSSGSITSKSDQIKNENLESLHKEIDKLNTFIACGNPKASIDNINKLVSILDTGGIEEGGGLIEGLMLRVDNENIHNIIYAYEDFLNFDDWKDLIDHIQKTKGLDREQIVAIAKKIASEQLELHLDKFIDQPEKFLLFLQVCALNDGLGYPQAVLFDLSEDRLRGLLDFITSVYYATPLERRPLITTAYIQLSSIFPLDSLKQFSLRSLFTFPELNKFFDFSKGYSVPRELDFRKLLGECRYCWPEFFFFANVSETERSKLQDIKLSIEPLISDESATHYLVRKSNWAQDFYKVDQIAYGRKLQEGTLIGLQAIQEGRWDFNQHLRFLEYHRNQMASELNQTDSANFGLLNCSNQRIATLCDKEPYLDLGRRMPELFDKWQNVGNPLFIEGPGNYIRNAWEGDWGYKHIVFNCNGKNLQLTTFAINDDGSLKAIIHPSIDILPDVLDYVSTIYNSSLKEENPEVLLQNLGKMFWLICQAKPWLRGDPSIAEMMIKTLWLHNTGVELPPWKEGIIIWEKVIESCDIDEFGNNFQTFFEENPLLLVKK